MIHPLNHWTIAQARFDEAARAFREGEMTIHVFRASLYSLGFRGREIETEVNLNWPRHAKAKS